MRRKLKNWLCRCDWSFKITHRKVAVIGAGLCGLASSIRLAERGYQVHLFEAAPKAGGRTRSFMDPETGELCDNGPHLLIGAYQRLTELLSDCNAAQYITWQDKLCLPLWDQQRQHFSLSPSGWPPFAMQLIHAVMRMPGHDIKSATAMWRLFIAAAKRRNQQSVKQLLQRLQVPEPLIRDLLEPLCLGAMNEPIHTADAGSFLRVLRESFQNGKTARLGWFNAPLDQALIAPLVEKAESLGVDIHYRHRVHNVVDEANSVNIDHQHFDAAVIALPAYATARLLERDESYATQAISNLHLWFHDYPPLSAPFVGGIGSTGQWFFDITQQMQSTNSDLRHICAVISADSEYLDEAALLPVILDELTAISGTPAAPVHARLIREKRATVLIRSRQHDLTEYRHIIDASEAPQPGELPATLELAVIRAESAVSHIFSLFDTH